MQTIRIKSGEKFRFIVEDEDGEIFNKVIDTSQITYHANREDVRVVDMPTMSSNDKKLFSETLGRSVTGSNGVSCTVDENLTAVKPDSEMVVDKAANTLTEEIKIAQLKDRGNA